MRFIRKKNFQEGEELLYAPRVHWMYTVKHLVLSLPFFLVLLILWSLSRPYGYMAGWFGGQESLLFSRMIIRHVFIAALVILLLDFVWRIFLYLSTEYGVTNRRLMLKKGILRVIVAEIPTDRIESIYCLQGLLGRIFRYGTICISGVGGMMPVFYMVSRPYALRRKIVEIIDKNKTITVVHGDLPRAKPAVKPEPVFEEEPIYRYGTFVKVLQNHLK
ncbi:MAG: PH domain-containing protein [Treponema sp.]|nr:PH domain-containing protein [Treponema sp.]